MDGCGSLRKFERTQDWLDQVESLKKPETTPSHWVPSTQYIFVRESDDQSGRHDSKSGIISMNFWKNMPVI